MKPQVIATPQFCRHNTNCTSGVACSLAYPRLDARRPFTHFRRRKVTRCESCQPKHPLLDQRIVIEAMARRRLLAAAAAALCRPNSAATARAPCNGWMPAASTELASWIKSAGPSFVRGSSVARCVMACRLGATHHNHLSSRQNVLRAQERRPFPCTPHKQHASFALPVALQHRSLAGCCTALISTRQYSSQPEQHRCGSCSLGDSCARRCVV